MLSLLAPENVSELTLEFKDAWERLLEERVAPQAAALDADADALRELCLELLSGPLLGFSVPVVWGGQGHGLREVDDVLERAAARSGAFAWMLAQHMSAEMVFCATLAQRARDEHGTLSKRPPQDFAPLVDGLARGTRRLALGSTHVLRPGPPILRATLDDQDVILEGLAPWITGLGLYTDVIITAPVGGAGEAQDGVAQMIVPFASSTGHGGQGRVSYSEPVALAAMQSSQTVSARFETFRVAAQDVLSRPGLASPLPGAVLGFPMGCARAALREAHAVLARKTSPVAARVVARLWDEWLACRREIASLALRQDGLEKAEAACAARAWLDDLNARCVQVAIMLVGGKACFPESPVQRLMKEAAVYSVASQRLNHLEQKLERLVR